MTPTVKPATKQSTSRVSQINSVIVGRIFRRTRDAIFQKILTDFVLGNPFQYWEYRHQETSKQSKDIRLPVLDFM